MKYMSFGMSSAENRNLNQEINEWLEGKKFSFIKMSEYAVEFSEGELILYHTSFLYEEENNSNSPIQK